MDPPLHLHLSFPAASPPWTAAWPSAPDTWATTGPPWRTSHRTRSPVSAPRRWPRPAAPQKRRESSCQQVSWVTRSPSVLTRVLCHHETVSQDTLKEDLCNINHWFTRSSSNVYCCQLLLGATKGIKKVNDDNLTVSPTTKNVRKTEHKPCFLQPFVKTDSSQKMSMSLNVLICH